MLCAACSCENPEAAKVCSRCGTAWTHLCGVCGAGSAAGAKFCSQCAAPLGAAASGAVSVRARASVQAERRHITVLFCDIVSSSALAERLDPEDLRELLRDYQARCSDVIRRWGGYVAQYLGDGMLAYFGYPTAHEDGPQRAVLAGLAIVRAAPQVGAPRALSAPIVQVRVGIHTGEVVVGEMGDAERSELLAVGETPNIAARIQAVAQPDTVVVSAATRRLVDGYFTFRELGVVQLKGLSSAVELFEALEDTGARSRLDSALPLALTPFVNRSAEVSFLLERWRDAEQGVAQVVVLSGEPGIGKSRLTRVLGERLAEHGVSSIECHCSQLFAGSALRPVIEMLERQLQFARDSSEQSKREKLEANLTQLKLDLTLYIPLFASLLSIPLDSRYRATSFVNPQRERLAIFEALVVWVRAASALRPLLFIVEDVHWADASTLELLGMLIEHVQARPLLLVFTRRSEFRPPWPAARVVDLSVPRLQPEAAEQILLATSKNQLFPDAAISEVLAKADGVPLYVEEITKAVLETGNTELFISRLEAGSAATLRIPSTVQGSLTARLDRLGAGKALIQLAATLGRSFRFELLQAVCGMEPDLLRSELDRLVGAELLTQQGVGPDETYTFRHALIQDVAYETLLRSTRQQYHRQIALTLSARFAALASAHPEVMANHYSAAGMPAEAIAQWELVGRRAVAGSAYLEARYAYEKALEQLWTVPASTLRNQQEVALRLELGAALISMHGYSAQEVADNLERARALCEQSGEIPPGLLLGLWGVYLVRGDAEVTERLALALERLVQTTDDALMAIPAYSALGVHAFFRADYLRAETWFARAMAMCEARGLEQQLIDLETMHNFEGYLYPIVYSAWSLTLRGLPERGLEVWQRALRLAERRGHPYVLTLTFAFGATLAHAVGDAARVLEMCARVMALATEHGFPLWYAVALTQTGWAHAQLNDPAQGVPMLEQGLAMLRAMGSFVVYPHHLSSLVDAYMISDRFDEALARADEALTINPGQLTCNHMALALRLKGEILARSGAPAEAERHFVQALELARSQHAKLVELQAGRSLAELWSKSGKTSEARDLLRGILATFSEGFDVPHVRNARALLALLE
jgi:class 3 adenylate cyclase/tetratricopeptide (TPR) repeat protein